MNGCANNNRDFSIDFLRAIAMVMVVLGHTMIGVTNDANQCFLFQLIWTLQMPLFFMISGFVSVYSKQPSSPSMFFKKLLRKTLCYMLPFVVWTFLIRGIILGQHGFFDFKTFAYSMDRGYWFLFVIWIITLIFETCSFVWKKVVKNNNPIILSLLILLSFIIFEGIFLGIGFLLSFNFLCIKLICYYLPFFYLGYLLSCFLNSSLAKHKIITIVVESLAFVFLTIWLLLIRKYDFYSLEESLNGIVLRFLASSLGSLSFFIIIFNCASFLGERLKYLFYWIGSHTLGIYLLHSILLNLIVITGESPSIMSIQGFGIVVLNFAVTMVLTCLLIWLLEKSRIVSKILFWK